MINYIKSHCIIFLCALVFLHELIKPRDDQNSLFDKNPEIIKNDFVNGF